MTLLEERYAEGTRAFEEGRYDVMISTLQSLTMLICLNTGRHRHNAFPKIAEILATTVLVDNRRAYNVPVGHLRSVLEAEYAQCASALEERDYDLVLDILHALVGYLRIRTGRGSIQR